MNKEIRKINKFYRKHREFIYYMNRKLVDRDDRYFMRKAETIPVKIKKGHYRNMGFSTPCDVLWARTKAMDLYTKFIEKEYSVLKRQSPHHVSPSIENKPLRWTASKASLTELIYALHEGKVFNYGNVDIQEITSLFEAFFDVRLPHIYRTYAAIKSRKGARARFLEELVFRLSQKMDNEDVV
ncbi:RteC domain-containing protein [Galbibacter sp. PAP.153]|uniref:RteC domain-containing protein n=1 Tax=Galbibacter sp. PAP.153 TaxID=3104623 RepID=UPI003008EFC4